MPHPTADESDADDLTQCHDAPGRWTARRCVRAEASVANVLPQCRHWVATEGKPSATNRERSCPVSWACTTSRCLPECVTRHVAQRHVFLRDATLRGATCRGIGGRAGGGGRNGNAR